MACYSLIKRDNFWKLDKIDKIYISFIFILVSFFSIFNCFSFAVENVDFETLTNLFVDEKTGIFKSSSSDSCVYFKAEKDYKYTIKVLNTFSSDRIVVSSSEEPSAGVVSNVLFSSLLNKGDYFTYTPVEDIYITVSRNVPRAYISVEREPLTGLDQTINKLGQYVGIDMIWSIFNKSIPFILIVVVFCLGFWFIRHNIIENSKGRDF